VNAIDPTDAREAVAALPGYQFGDITEQGLRRTLDEVDLKLDANGASAGQMAVVARRVTGRPPVSSRLACRIRLSGECNTARYSSAVCQ
jgi:hypothetical protein